jgi:hypothetical protein
VRKPRLVAAIVGLTVLAALASVALPADAAGSGAHLIAGPASTNLNYGSAAMAYDQDTSQLLLYGGASTWGSGCSCDNSGDMRVWDGTNWQLLYAQDLRDVIYMHLIYDAATHQMLSFGGLGDDSQAPALMGMEAWNGQAWIALAQPHRPAGRVADTAAYDPATGQLIRFGGIDINNRVHNDTWTWDGTSWTLLHPATSPSARINSISGYDDATGQFVLAGGQNAAGTQLRDTWIWTGTTWKQRIGATSPKITTGATGAAFDPALNSLVVTADASTGTGTDVWKWTGSAWVEITTAALPSDVDWVQIAWDGATSQLVLITSYGISTRPPVAQGNWVLAAPTTSTLTASPAQVSYPAGQPIKLTVTVKATKFAVPAGQVTFTDNNVRVVGCESIPVTAGAAGCTLTPGAGPHTLRTQFSPVSGFLASSSPNLVLNVAP